MVALLPERFDYNASNPTVPAMTPFVPRCI